MKINALVAFLLVGSTVAVFAQPTTVTNPNDLIGADNAITTAVPFLGITPDARHAALGETGVATSPDANSTFWNAAKLVFIDKKFGGSLSYTPWLGKIVNDMSVSYLSGFYKLNNEQAFGLGFKYFNLGDISFRSQNNEPLGDFNPREYAFDLTYSRKLSEVLSVGLSGRYIHSNLTGAFSGIDAQPGNSVAVDLGVYYVKELQSTRNATLSLGGAINNIGAKLTYTDETNRNFLPTLLKLGAAYKMDLDPSNTITFILDFNKLMVPTPPVRDGNGVIIAGKENNRSLLSGMFGSFADAPAGFKEEINEIMTSAGIEYWYRDIFAARMGYFNEAKTKGNRKYLTFGAGFRRDRFGLDIAYLVPTNRREHPLAETVRFTLLFEIRETLVDKEKSVTD